jgi:N-acetylmuramoyl-L-alanine amidase
VERNCPDVKVIYTRKTDVFVPLDGRANIANRNKADLFVSIHCNALPGRKISRGMETYTLGMHRAQDNLDVAKRENEVILIEKDYKQHYSGYDPRSPESTLIFEVINEKNMLESVELAQLIQQHTCAVARRPNKGVRQDAFLVLRETSMPACLIELGYITTPAEKNYLTNAHNVDLMGKGIYQAFVAFKNKQQGKSKSTSTPAATPKEETVAEPVNNQEPAAVNKTRSVNAKNVPVRNAKNSLAAELEEGRPMKDVVPLKKVEQKAEQKVEQKKIEQPVVELLQSL